VADNIELSAGSGGAVLSTDEVTRATVVQHVQYVKLMNGTDAATDVIPGDATNGLDVDVTRCALPSGASTAANQTTIIGHLDGVEGLLTTIDADTGALAACASGTELQVDVVAALPAGDNNIGNVDVVTLPNVTLAAGTNTNEVVGDAAHDAAIAGNPVRIGLRGMSADYTAVASGDTADALASLTGKQVVLPYAVPGASWSYASPAAVTDTADDEAKAAGAAGVRHYITGVQVFNGHDTVGTEVVIKDGTSVLWRGWAEQTGGGCSAKFDPPLRGTAATAVNVANITTGSSTYFNLQGYSAAE
jgi:hypothetical protein